MYLFPCSREELLNFLPRGGTGCEIGVAYGAYSAKILENAIPRKLHLIDPWEHQDREDYSRDPTNSSDEDHERRYQSVLANFASRISDGTVEVHRKYSDDAVSGFPDGHFDYVYIDGRHSKEGVLEDLVNFAPKVKEGGFIFGDDFSNHVPAQNMRFGVIEAVLEFCQRGEFSLLGITLQEHPNFVLVRDVAHPEIQTFLANIQFHYPNIAKINGLSNPSDISMTLTRITSGPDTHNGTIIEFHLG